LQRKSLAILAYGIWRWKLLAGANNDTRPFFNMWMPTVFRWLITREEDRFLRVQPTEQLFSRGEPIGFEAQAYNENYEPVDDADIRIDVRSLASEQRYQTILQSLGNGRYEGNIEGLVEGEYSTVATGTRNGAPYGTVTGRFSVGEQSIEFADTRCDAALLQQLSSATGGRYADVSHASELIDDLLSRQTMKPQPQTKTSEIELWNSPVLLLMIVLLLGIEWFVRKRSGML
jgi:hypothetical protein